MLQSRDFPAWLVGLLIAAGCATAENGAAPDHGSTADKGGSAPAGSAGKAGLGSSGAPSTSGAGGGAKAGATSGGNALGGNGATGTGTGGNAEGGSLVEQGGSSQGGSGSAAGSGGGGSGAPGAGSSPSGSAGSGGAAGSSGGTALGCDDPLYVLCDDFEDGNANGWSTSGGTWTVVQSGSHVYKGANGGYQAFAGDAGMTDQSVEAKLSNVDFGGSGSSYRAGVIARRTSTSNFYTVVLDAVGDLRLLKGSSSPSSSSGACDAAQVSPGASFTLRLEVTGTTGNVNLKTYLDGNQVHDCTTTSGTLASGSAGVYTYGSNSVAEFDDFKVSVP